MVLLSIICFCMGSFVGLATAYLIGCKQKEKEDIFMEENKELTDTEKIEVLKKLLIITMKKVDILEEAVKKLGGDLSEEKTDNA